MKVLALTICAAAALLYPAAALPATPTHTEPTVKRATLVKTIKHSRTTVRWWISHRPVKRPPIRIHTGLPGSQRLRFVPVPLRLCPSIGIRSPDAVCAKARRMRRAQRLLAKLDAELAAAAATALPAHHALWMCIHSHEAGDWGNQDTGHNGHYGGLQMHESWGYGTSKHASDDSQYVQERAAEAGYRASGYSRTWLLGQWYHPDCLSYAS